MSLLVQPTVVCHLYNAFRHILQRQSAGNEYKFSLSLAAKILTNKRRIKTVTKFKTFLLMCANIIKTKYVVYSYTMNTERDKTVTFGMRRREENERRKQKKKKSRKLNGSNGSTNTQ